MTTAGLFPMLVPPSARGAFESDAVMRRLLRTSHLDKGSRVLEVAGAVPSSALWVAKECGCMATVVSDDGAALEKWKEGAQKLNIPLEFRQVSFEALPFPGESFDAIFALGPPVAPLPQQLKWLVPLLAPSARLMVSYPVKVGRFPGREALEQWEKRLGAPVETPKDTLQHLERAGLEPEGAETLSDAELDQYYKKLLPLLDELPASAASALKEEMALFSSYASRASVSYVACIGRKKVPGERPPAPRDRG